MTKTNYMEKIKLRTKNFIKSLSSQKSTHPSENSATLTSEIIIWGYRLFLEREPENQNVIDEKASNFSTVRELRKTFLSSREYKKNAKRIMKKTTLNFFYIVAQKLLKLNKLFVNNKTEVNRIQKSETAFSTLVHKRFKQQVVITSIKELNNKLDEINEAAAISDDAVRKVFASFRMELDWQFPSNPYSKEYFEKQFELYEYIAGKPYHSSNEISDFDVQNAVQSPFPFYTQSPDTVGNQLISIGFLIKQLKIKPASSILEFGAGWGNTTIFLSQMGYEVTVIDIENNFLELIQKRSRNNGLKIETIKGDFLDASNFNKKFDVLLFYESFHHCSDHLALIKSFNELVSPGGIVMFAAEPIIESFPLPWGIRLDGESCWAIRGNGWLELGFKESYFINTMKKYGWETQKYVCDETPWGTLFLAKRLL